MKKNYKYNHKHINYMTYYRRHIHIMHINNIEIEKRELNNTKFLRNNNVINLF